MFVDLNVSDQKVQEDFDKLLQEQKKQIPFEIRVNTTNARTKLGDLDPHQTGWRPGFDGKAYLLVGDEHSSMYLTVKGMSTLPASTIIPYLLVGG